MSDPLLTVSAAGLRAAGVTLSAAEAVACVLLTGKALGWSSDAPEPSRVILRGDGRISVSPPPGKEKDTAEKPGPSSVRVETYARLLHRLLPEGAVHSAQIPGALRLTVARGVGALDAPPFASIEDFRTAIARFANEPPEDHIVAAVVRWAEVIGAQTDDRLPERRVAGPRVDVLRRMLRDADLERYAIIASASSREAPHAAVATRTADRDSRRTGMERPAPALLRLPTFEPDAAEPPVRWRAFAAVAVLAATSGYLGAVLVRDGAPFVAPSFVESARTSTDVDVASEHEDTSASSAAGGSDVRGGETAENAANPMDTGGADGPDGTPPRGARGSAAPAAAPGQPWPSDPIATSGATNPLPAGTRGDVPAKASITPQQTAIAPAWPQGTEERTVIDAGFVTYSGFRLANVIDGQHHTSNVRLSPDGARVAFDSDREGERGVYIAARDGTGVRRVSGPLPARAPAWAPDGKRLAFLRSEEDDPRVRNLWLRHLESGEERRLTAWRYGETSPADWFADGRRLCYAHNGRLYVMDLETGASRSYASPVQGKAINAIAASPDGSRLAFHVKGDGVWVLDLAKGQTRRVLEDAGVEQLAWSPTGTSLAYHSAQSGSWAVHVVGR